jgi:F0F1-type ATP synthase alpha subunit
VAEITAAEISDIIKRQIEGYVSEIELAEVGSVITVGDGIARIYGLEKCLAGELLQFPHDIYGASPSWSPWRQHIWHVGQTTRYGSGLPPDLPYLPSSVSPPFGY